MPVVRPSKNGSAVEGSHIRRDGLPAGTIAPEFNLPGLRDGESHRLKDWRGNKVLLLFSDPHCEPCAQVSEQLQREHSSRTDIHLVAISRGDAETNLAKAEKLGLSYPILLQKSWEVSRDYGIFATPVAYLIDERGVLLTDVAVGVESILNLLRTPQELLTSKMKDRLERLQTELLKGQEELRTLDKRRQYLLEMMLRINGAQQVLSEMIEGFGAAEPSASK